MRFATLAEWLHWQEQLHLSEIDLGLERCGEVYRTLGLAHPAHAVITVAGTNGKGSSVAMLDAILRAAGYRTGCYTSPHLLHYNERITLDGEPVSDAQLCETFERIDQARGETSLTYFEFGTLAAFDIFHRSGIDVAILEVGLGGRLDAVNLADADLALITAIDIDHVGWLGSDRESIAVEKGGIMRSGHPAVCSDPLPPESLLALADELAAPLARLGHDYGYRIVDGGWEWWWRGESAVALPLPTLRGRFQLQNAAGVLAALHQLKERLPLATQQIRQGLLEATVVGRFQRLETPEGRELILDVAHNPQAAGELAANLSERPFPGRTHGVVAMLADKDIGAVLAKLEGSIDYWYPASLEVARGAGAEELHALLGRQGIEPASSYARVDEALVVARGRATEGDRIVVFGSFYTVAAALTAQTTT